VLLQQLDIRSAGARKGHFMARSCLRAREIHSDIHDSIPDLMAMIAEV
jgi:hypothetical protein